MKPPIKLSPTPPGVPKLSQSLAEFAGPLLVNVKTTADFERAIALAVELWNIGLLPEARQGEALWRLTNQLRQHPASKIPGWAGADLAEFVKQRKTHFAADHRLIREHRVIWHKNQPRLEVLSYDLDIAAETAKAAPAA